MRAELAAPLAPDRFGPIPRRTGPLAVIVGTVASAWLWAGICMTHVVRKLPTLPTPAFPRNRWLDAWVRWDAGWYATIARSGYSYTPGEQSSVAYFPTYPLLMRWLGAVVGNVFLAGIIITLLCGIGYVRLAWSWFATRLTPTGTWCAFLLLCWYPFAFYLYGPVYSDALFAVAALGAFVLLERNRPILAGIAGAVATATRPVGIAVIIGLVALTLTRREVFVRTPRFAMRLRRLQARDYGVLVSISGMVAYLSYLAFRFGDPLVFVHAEAGWDQAPGYQTWLKFPLLRALSEGQELVWIWRHGMHFAAGIIALLLLMRVWKRFGVAYFLYAFVIIAIPMLSTKDFFSTGRYLLPAFPCFAAAGELLAPRRRTRVLVIGASAGLLAVYVYLFARGHYVA